MAIQVPTIASPDSTGEQTPTPDTQAPAPETSPAAPVESEPAKESPTVTPGEFSGDREVDEAVLDMLALQEEQEEEPAQPPTEVPPVVAPPPSEPVAPAPVEQPAPVAPAVAKPQEAPVPPPVEPAQAAPVTPVTPPEQQGQQPAPAKAAVEAPKVPKPGEFAELAQAVQEQRTALEGSLAEAYTPSEKQMEEFHIEPQKVLGRLAARIHLEIVQNTLGVLAQNIPSAVNGVIEARQTHDKLEDTFYKEWPQLKREDAAHSGVVMQIARAYAQANANVDSKTRIRQIGAQAMVALNLLPTQPVAAPVAAPVKQPAFAPAANSGSAAPAPAQQLQGWEAIDASFEESER